MTETPSLSDSAETLQALLADPVKGPIVEQVMRKMMRPFARFARKHLSETPVYKPHTVRTGGR